MDESLVLIIGAAAAGVFITKLELDREEAPPDCPQNHRKMVENMNKHRDSLNYEQIDTVDE